MKGDIGGSEAVRGVVGRRGDGSGHEPGAGMWLPTPIEANNHVIVIINYNIYSLKSYVLTKMFRILLE